MSGRRSGGTGFRPEVQGLRAIAVLLVLVYHSGATVIPGGYAGVDVFFVISGFLITGHLLASLAEHGRIDLPRFFARRARRILPAALAVAAATVGVGLVVVPPLEQARLVGDAVAAVLFVPNLRFGVEGTDYLADDEPSIFQHYWSLGVEEQFYLLWPLLLALGAVVVVRVRRRFLDDRSNPSTDAATTRRAVVLVAIAVIVLSLAWSITQTPTAGPWAFFGLPSRAWEFAAGGLLATVLVRERPSLDGRAGAVIGWVGLATVLAAALLFTDELAYPGAWAVVPVVGTLLAIAGGGARHPWSPRAVLGSRPMLVIGAISYSLYLVHWPLQAIPQSTMVTGGSVPEATRLLLAAASVPVAWLVYRTVEVPFRRPRGLGNHGPGRSVIAGLAASVVVAGALFTVGQIAPARALVGDPVPPRPGATASAARPSPEAGGRLPTNLVPSLAAAEHDLPSIFDTGCELGRVGTDPSGCAFGAQGPRVVTFGDSHTAHWTPAFEALAERGLIRLSNHSKSSCPSVDIPATFRGSDDYPECHRWRERVIERVRADPPDIVVLANYGGNEFAVPRTDVAERWREGLERTIRRLPETTRVLVIAETPDLGYNPATCLSVHADDLSHCAPSRADALPQDLRDAELASTAATGTRLVDLTEWFCDARACPPVSGSLLVYRDSHHVTATFARAMTDVFGRELGVVSSGTPTAASGPTPTVPSAHQSVPSRRRTWLRKTSVIRSSRSSREPSSRGAPSAPGGANASHRPSSWNTDPRNTPSRSPSPTRTT